MSWGTDCVGQNSRTTIAVIFLVLNYFGQFPSPLKSEVYLDMEKINSRVTITSNAEVLCE